MPYENLAIDRDGQIGIITLGRPEKLNAINRELHLEMMEAWSFGTMTASVWSSSQGKDAGSAPAQTLPAGARAMNIPAERNGWMNTTGWDGRP